MGNQSGYLLSPTILSGTRMYSLRVWSGRRLDGPPGVGDVIAPGTAPPTRPPGATAADTLL